MRAVQRIDLRSLQRRKSGGLAAHLAIAPAPPLTIEPRLAPSDETAFWLTAAAEIEHALLVQYLFAAYSLDEAQSEAKSLKQVLLQIAREEMAI